MSKIFAESSIRKAVRAYWRRFAGSGTAWQTSGPLSLFRGVVRTARAHALASILASRDRYRFDPFFRTEVNVIALQVSFALVILGLVGTSFTLLYHDVSAAIVEGIRAGVSSNTPGIFGTAIVEQIREIRSQNLSIIVSVIVITTILFGYIVARITLAPTRNALTSQKQFIGNIAHELRTPLSVIKTNTEVALMAAGMDRDLKDTLLSNVEELDRISEIINNLLSLSTLVKPERMEFAAVDLGGVASDVIRAFTPLAKRSDLKVTLRKSPGCDVWGNATALSQIVGNLTKNAIQYTPRGGDVAVTISPRPQNMVELAVQDSGIGLAQQDLFRIFEPFYRADPSRARRHGGSGLGLTIVSELVKMHGGKIAIRSALGRGTSVSVLLPAAGAGVGTEVATVPRLNEIAVDFSSRQS